MVKVYRYVDPTNGWSVDLGNQVVRLGTETGYSQVAEAGGAGGSTVTFDDLTGALGHSGDGILGLKQFVIDESAAPSGNQRLLTSWIGARRYYVGADSLRTGVMRKIEATLSDLNACLGFRRITGTDGDRVAETASARLAWILGSTYVAGLVADNGFVEYMASVDMDANDYRTQTPNDVIADVALATHMNFFCYYDEAAGEVSLWMDDPDTAYTYRSTARLSTYLADKDEAGGTYIADSVVLTRDPARVFAGVVQQYANGVRYDTEPTTADVYAWRDGVAPNGNVQTDAAAANLNTLFLADSATEDDRIGGRVDIAATDVNAIHAGQLISARFRHLTFTAPIPDYSDWSYFRVMKWAPAQPLDTDQRYIVDFELTPANPVIVATDGQLQAPQSSQYVDGGLFDVHWDHDGDDPGGGCSGLALTGLLAYQGASGERTGLVIGGDGLVNIGCHGTVSGAVAGGSYTMDAYVFLNGEQIGHDTQTTTGGARALSWTWDIALTDVDVLAGDVVTCKFSVSPEPAIFVIPAGVGDCLNVLRVTGNLAA